MKTTTSLLVMLMVTVSCSTPQHGDRQRAIQAAKDMYGEAAKKSVDPEEELKKLEMLACFTFPTSRGWAVVTTLTPEEIKLVKLDNTGNPCDPEWAYLVTQASTTPMADKHDAVRIAQRLWTDAGNTNKLPCYAVPISEGWLAIFGGYGKAITVLVDGHGKVYDSTWIE